MKDVMFPLVDKIEIFSTAIGSLTALVSLVVLVASIWRAHSKNHSREKKIDD